MSLKFSERMERLSGTATREILKYSSNPDVISFAGGLPAKEFLPVDELREIADEVLTGEDKYPALSYGKTSGVDALREELCTYVKDVGIENAKVENTLVVSGGQQGIDLMSKAFLDSGDIVLVEDPTYLAVLQIFAAYGARAVGVKTVSDGLDIDDLEQKIIQFKPKFIYLVPTFSNPTGKTYSIANRRLIASLSAKYGIPVLEDDPYSKLRFSGEPVPCLKHYDQEGLTVYVSSFSKILSPGLRVAAVVGNADIMRKMEICKQGQDVHSSHLSQYITLRYIKRGSIYPNIEKALPLYRTRKAALIEAIKRYMPDEFIYNDPDGGLFVWGEFKGCDIDAEAIFNEAAAANAVYVWGSVFYADSIKGKNAIRLNFSNESPERIDKGMKILGKFFKEKLTEK